MRRTTKKARRGGALSGAEIRARLKLVDRAFGTVSAQDYDRLARSATWYAERYDEALTLLSRAATAMGFCSAGKDEHKEIRKVIVAFLEREERKAK